MKRARLVSGATLALLLLVAAPAWAINTKVTRVEFKHVDQNNASDYTTRLGSQNQTKVTGKVKLDDSKNPPNLPPEKVQCYQSRTVKIYLIDPGPDTLMGRDRTNDLGKFAKTFAHKHGTFYFVIPEKDTTNVEYYCYEEESDDYPHNH
jgi:hypothetical protein